MTILCVDDEELILGLTVSLCQELPYHPEGEGFTRAKDALDWLAVHTADIALLDINMPDMDGLSLAMKIKEICPHTAVIFLTGFAQYAVDAFKLHTSGYILKPVSRERLLTEIDYALSDKHTSDTNSHVVIRTFGDFDLLIDGQPVSFQRTKAKELLAYLVDRQGATVTRATAFAVLWPDGLYDRKMQKQLDVIIRSLRDTLLANGISEIVEMKRGTLRICPEKVSCDLYRFFEGDIEMINAYHGEYMSAYTWASLTEAYVERINNTKEMNNGTVKSNGTRKGKSV